MMTCVYPLGADRGPGNPSEAGKRSTESSFPMLSVALCLCGSVALCLCASVVFILSHHALRLSAGISMGMLTFVDPRTPATKDR